MKLIELIEQYIDYRKSLGEKFKTNETYLKSFCKTMGKLTSIDKITEKEINHFLYGDSQSITSAWFIKHTAILGFYQYALRRGYVSDIPLPRVLPKRPPPFIPYIYSKKELKDLFYMALIYPTNKSHISPVMVRAVLVLTYALGLRLHEAVAITLGDIDRENSVITIKETKFYKSRLVPFNSQIKEFIDTYWDWRLKQHQSQSLEASLFIGKNNQAFNANTMRGIFQRIRQQAGIKRNDGARYQPRIHDLRHTFAVNRLTLWYKENKDVQQLLPVLSVYLGHKYLAHTAVYLTMTDNLLQEANKRFERYILGEKK
jgi:site-specific recombinase XerD